MTEEITSQEQKQPTADVEALKKSVEGLERKNRELIGKLKAYKAIPDGVDVQALIDYRANAEQQQLESKGQYIEAKAALEAQFRELSTEKDQQIKELTERVQELELMAPAVSALSDVVHDPQLVLNTQLKRDQIQREPDGTVVVVDGYERTPVGEWAKAKTPAWMQKAPKPQGSGAPSSRASGEITPGTKNPFSAESFNLTEQSRLYKTDRDLYGRLKNAANR
jgi:hypothetical protein